jgi:hypothetical protein
MTVALIGGLMLVKQSTKSGSRDQDAACERSTSAELAVERA